MVCKPRQNVYGRLPKAPIFGHRCPARRNDLAASRASAASLPLASACEGAPLPSTSRTQPALASMPRRGVGSACTACGRSILGSFAFGSASGMIRGMRASLTTPSAEGSPPGKSLRPMQSLGKQFLRIQKHDGEVKLIFIMRDPLDGPGLPSTTRCERVKSTARSPWRRLLPEHARPVPPRAPPIPRPSEPWRRCSSPLASLLLLRRSQGSAGEACDRSFVSQRNA